MVTFFLASATVLGDQAFYLFAPSPTSSTQRTVDAPPPRFSAVIGSDEDVERDGAGDRTAESPEPSMSERRFSERRPETPRARSFALASGVLLGCSISFVRRDGPQAFHVVDERFFGKGTYAGGADKASHFVFYNALSRELAITFSRMGHSRNQAILLGAAVSVGGGLLTELSDGVNRSGFSWEDLLLDSLGASTAAAVTYYGLDDVVGFRFGKIAAREPSACCRYPGSGKDYTSEIYTGDLKLAGAARRLHVEPGLFRFLLLSMTYGAKGYRYSPPALRQRNIGAEIGINFPQILSEIGVQDTTWWGRALFLFFNFVRLPYTSVGFHYDLNHRAWLGPDFGQQEFDPGP